MNATNGVESLNVWELCDLGEVESESHFLLYIL